MLPPFQILRISASGYDQTISDHPSAALKYQDEERDTITIGSSNELIQRLVEPVPPQSGTAARSSLNPMAIATMLAEEQKPSKAEHHSFDIDDDEGVKSVWQSIQAEHDPRHAAAPLEETVPVNKSTPAKSSSPTVSDPTTRNRLGRTAEEDALRLQLRDQGMEWGEVEAKVAAYGASSCKLHCANNVWNEDMWTEEKMNKLAKVYERLRMDVWKPIADELCIPWDSVEGMHWSMGMDEMSLRAQGVPIEPKLPQLSAPIKLMNNEDSGNPTLKRAVQEPVIPFQNFEDRRIHHFNASKPPQLSISDLGRRAGSNRLSSRDPSAGNVPKNFPPFKISPPFTHGASTPTTNPHRQSEPATVLQKVCSSPMATENVPESCQGSVGQRSIKSNGHSVPSLTIEGKRQAQAAGDKLRARTSHRRALMTANDNASHQNRWAEYKASGSVFTPKAAFDMSKDFSGPSLTSEGKRQAQVAGDKLRLRTNPIRHSRPSRGSVSDHGINKNRWSSYGAARVTRFDERHDAHESKQQPQSGATEKDEQRKQPSLLEVFESELAKKQSSSDSQRPTEGLVLEADFVPPEFGTVIDSADPKSVASASVGHLPPQPITPFMDGFKVINEHLQGLTLKSTGPSQELSGVIGKSVRTAFVGFNSFLQSISSGIQEASNMTRQVADRTREFDGGLLEKAATQLLSVEKDVAALSKEVESIGQKTNETKESNVGQNTATSKPSSRSDVADEAPASESTLSEPTKAVSIPTAKRSMPNGKFEVPMESDDEEYDSPTLPSKNQTTDKATIPLPQPCSQSVETSYAIDAGRSATLPPMQNRFPTLAQFESQSFAPSFPPLPSMSMEPLVPQRAKPRFTCKEPEIQSQPTQIATGSSQMHQNEHLKTVRATTTDELLRKNGINPGYLSATQCAAFDQQNPQIQQKSIQVYAQNLANNYKRPALLTSGGICYPQHLGLSTNEGIPSLSHPATTQNQGIHVYPPGSAVAFPQDYQSQLMLLEQQNKRRLHMARGEKPESEEDAVMSIGRSISPYQELRPRDNQEDEVSVATGLDQTPQGLQALQESENNRRIQAEQTKDTISSKLNVSSDAPRPFWLSPTERATGKDDGSRECDGHARYDRALHDYQMQLTLLEQQQKKQHFKEWQKKENAAASRSQSAEFEAPPMPQPQEVTQVHVFSDPGLGIKDARQQEIQQNQRWVGQEMYLQQQTQSSENLNQAEPIRGFTATQSLKGALPLHLQQQHSPLRMAQIQREMQHYQTQRQQAPQSAARLEMQQQQQELQMAQMQRKMQYYQTMRQANLQPYARLEMQQSQQQLQTAILRHQRIMEQRAHQQQVVQQDQLQQATQQAEERAQREATHAQQQKLQQQAQQPPLLAVHSLVKAEDFSRLTYLSDDTQEKYRNGVAKLHKILECAPQESQQYQNAYQKLLLVSAKVRTSMQQQQKKEAIAEQQRQSAMNQAEWSGKADGVAGWSDSEEDEKDREHLLEESKTSFTDKSRITNVVDVERHSEGLLEYADGPLEENKKAVTALPSAARLVEPFDPLDAIPSTPPHLTEGIRRNATIAGTDSRHNARRRRPYSEAFDGKGRVEWDSFLQHDRREPRNVPVRGPLNQAPTNNVPRARKDQATRAPLNEKDRKVSDCIRQLKDLGFLKDLSLLKNERGAEERLAIYAQAAGGDLVEAIDMIDEEERAYRERL
ncbi:hypothetical protein P7C71_g4038, partial [Lecanoromycetidae sp. Uapishka_2]